MFGNVPRQCLIIRYTEMPIGSPLCGILGKSPKIALQIAGLFSTGVQNTTATKLKPLNVTE